MMAEYTLHFLGPTGTFTHQAAIEAARRSAHPAHP